MKILVRNEGQKNWKTVISFSYKAEADLQKLLSDSPDLIPSKEMRDNAGDLIAAIREFPLPIGSVDLVAFSAYGDIAIIECKLADNPEVKRKVIGQVLEYGAALWGMSYEDFDLIITQKTGKSLADFIRDSVEDPDWDEEGFRVHIEQNLKDGDFILVIVVDEINENMTQIVRFINACGNPTFSFAALEMRRFHSDMTEILVPRVDGDVRKPKQAVPSERVSWNKEKVITDAKEKLSPNAFILFEDLFAFCETHSQASVKFGTGKANGSITFYALKDSLKASIFSVYSHGDLMINLGYMSKIYSHEQIDVLKQSLSKISPFKSIQTSDKYFYTIKIGKDIYQKDDIEKFKSTILDFLNQMYT